MVFPPFTALLATPVPTDRFLVAYVPDVGGIAGTPHAVEYAFASSMQASIEELRRVVTESPGGAGSAAYVHDLDGGMD